MKKPIKKTKLKIGEPLEISITDSKGKILTKKLIEISNVTLRIPEFSNSKIETILTINQLDHTRIKIIPRGGYNCRHSLKFLEPCEDGKKKVKKRLEKKVKKILTPKRKKK